MTSAVAMLRAARPRSRRNVRRCWPKGMARRTAGGDPGTRCGGKRRVPGPEPWTEQRSRANPPKGNSPLAFKIMLCPPPATPSSSRQTLRRCAQISKPSSIWQATRRQLAQLVRTSRRHFAAWQRVSWRVSRQPCPQSVALASWPPRPRRDCKFSRPPWATRGRRILVRGIVLLLLPRLETCGALVAANSAARPWRRHHRRGAAPSLGTPPQ
mmetsp:Transcript_35652/g.98297  ORF Transcript_35652/g.98297 Transcript_35652/m.98297 type:complete len:212 (-) Transcript_35652:817-1452(-)